MKRIIAVIALLFLFAGNVWATDQTIKATEEMVGSGHGTKADTLNRLMLVEHGTDGTHATAGLTLIASVTANNSATIDFTSIGNTTYDSYLIVGTAVQPANDNVLLYLRFSQAATFDATANHYQSAVWRWTSAASGFGGSAPGAGATAFHINAGENLGNQVNEEISFVVRVDNCAQTGEIHRAMWESSYVSLTPTSIGNKGSGEFAATGAVDGFRFLMSSGNITSGTIKLYGLKN